MATHASILAWEIPWTEEPGGIQSMGLQRIKHDWACMHALMHVLYAVLYSKVHKITTTCRGYTNNAMYANLRDWTCKHMLVS